ncbi:fatty acyl-CoA reductase wat-like isoform X2 [Bradysia coprophila]|uniref:fatty acyl-CoA reductase wat-like isoform X2 n=1 Tax=Bradysia coprophila TaxID=38358 RepID=UPI00187D711E|nr:fatty acyl-CoA reductase wat-like isoform X2 [Bradysia coprophila]
MSMPVISALDFTGESMVDETITNDSPMKRFYRNKTVFITGGLGFLGQLFIEKLLRCRVKEVYVLVRPKKNKSSIERMRETFVGDVFVKLKSIDPNYFERIKLIEGDTYKADIGISQQDRKELIENVEIVLHAAADVRFDRSLQELCFTNVRGTKAVTMLAEEMKNLIVFAYVSTAYSQFYRDKIDEKFYPPPCDPDEVIRISEYFDKHKTNEFELLTDKMIHPWENTYVFTKSLSEEVVRRASHKIPTVVTRPSIVMSTYEEPIPGWANNVYGINGITIGSGYGFIKVVPSGPNSRTNVICADIVVNGTLAAIWSKANEKRSPSLQNSDESSTIYHITAQNALTNVLLFSLLCRRSQKIVL